VRCELENKLSGERNSSADIVVSPSPEFALVDNYNLGNNHRIKYFILSAYDQDGNTISDMTDYIIHIQFTINKKSQQEQLLKTLIDYNKQSYSIIGHIFDKLNNFYNYFFKIKSNE
jgi:hypothetical protein